MLQILSRYLEGRISYILDSVMSCHGSSLLLTPVLLLLPNIPGQALWCSVSLREVITDSLLYLGLKSRDVVIYNYSKTLGNYSDHGDLGDGDRLAILHSGMPRDMHNHVTYGMPLWWVIKQILGKYLSAEFYGIIYTLD